MADIGSGGLDYNKLKSYLKQAFEIGLDSGSVAFATSTSITDATKNWGTDQWKNAYVEITDGTGKGQIRLIVSNTENTSVVSSAWATIPDYTSKYRIFGAPSEVNQLISILNQLDIKLSELRDALRGTGNKTLTDLETDLSNILGQFDITLSTLSDNLLEPTLDALVLNNATVNTTGSSGNLTIKGAKHVDVLIYVGTPTGTPSIQFHLQVIEPASGQVIRTYDGTSLSASGSDWITVDGLLLGTTIKVTWDGTLDASNYFSGVFCRAVAKR